MIDPEVGINIVDLGLVYDVHERHGHVRVSMTMTTPACPLGEVVCREAADAIRRHVPACDPSPSTWYGSRRGSRR